MGYFIFYSGGRWGNYVTTCSGSGKNNCYYCDDTGYVDCPRCDGDDTCKKCNGDGWRW